MIILIVYMVYVLTSIREVVYLFIGLYTDGELTVVVFPALPVIQDLLERVVSTLSDIPEESIFPLLDYMGSDSSVKKMKLTALQNRGVDMAVR